MSTLRVSNLQNEASANNQITLGTDGFAQINGVAMPTAGPLSSRNLIVNGAMAVAQRGTSSTTSGYATVDRFRAGYGGGTQTQSQVAITSGDPFDEGFRYIMRVTNTATATAAGNNRNITYKIEAQDIAHSGWNYTSATSYITLSFWVRASVAQTYYVRFQTSDGTGQNYGSAFALSADTWTKVTKTIPGNSNITINSDNGTGLQVIFVPFDGTDFTDSGFTTDAWGTYSSSNRLPDMTNTWAGTTDATFDITGVQLEVGSVATPFEHRSYGDELARCQRYYQEIPIQTYSYCGYCFSQTDARAAIPLITTMRAAPTGITTTGSPRFSTGGGGGTGSIVFAHATTNVLGIQSSGASSLWGQGGVSALRASSTNATISVSAEL